MPAPERRTRLDLVVAASLVVAVLVVTGLVWLRSDARATVSEQSPVELPALEAATTVPDQLTEAWSAPSGATTTPVVAAGAVVSADGSAVEGRDPATGEVRWTYRRDLALCAVTGQWDHAVAVYRAEGGCSEVTALRGGTGARGAQRSSGADDEVSLVGEGTYLASAGTTRMEVWRSDLVRTLEFGRVDAPAVPDAQTRTGCTTDSLAAGAGRIAVVLTCPDQADRQLVLLDASPDSDERVPTEFGAAPLSSPQATVLAVTAERAAVFLPTAADGSPDPRVAVFDASAALLGEYPVQVETSGSGVADAPVVAPVQTAGSVLTWSVGSAVVGLSATDLTPVWIFPGALGPGAEVAGQLLLPVDGAMAVMDPATGTETRRIAVDRSGYARETDGPVRTAVAGSVVLELRGSELVALS